MPDARRRTTIAAALATGVALLTVRGFDHGHALGAPAGLAAVATSTLLAYALGTNAGIAVGVVGIALLSAGMQATGGEGFNPLFEMLTIGPWLAGRAVQSRRRLARQIEARNSELAAERTLYALESMRYERARIARELHDIVAHCVSVIVVQATAGQRAAPDDALDAIAEAAEEAQREISLLTRHLDGATRPEGLRAVEELARRAADAGLAVRYLASDDLSALSPAASDTAYRVVQESVTNAIKHAPGSPIDIAVRAAGEHVEVEVTTAPPRSAPSGLELAGSGRGLAGMAHRVAACAGTLEAGPTPAGGWRVTARLPATPERAPA
ncbi:MAG TPA: ATP-binding protein [Gaiellaceae bacterium]